MNNKTLKRQKFAEEYIKTGNARKAAEAAGSKSPKKAATRLLKSPEVKNAIEKAVKESEKAAAWNMETAFKELEEAQSLAKKNTEAPQASAFIKAIELKCKLTGMLVEKQETTLKGAVDTEHIITFANKRTKNK